MNRQILGFGLLGGLLITLLKVFEYRILMIGLPAEGYAGVVAVLFASVGIWLGRRLGRPRPSAPAAVATEYLPVRPAAEGFVRNVDRVDSLRITPRELEILELIAEGLSNRDIAERIFVSENTAKTHASRLFDKLDARRRTQAVQIGKQLGLIP